MRKDKRTLEDFYFLLPLIAFVMLVIGLIILFK